MRVLLRLGYIVGIISAFQLGRSCEVNPSRAFPLTTIALGMAGVLIFDYAARRVIEPPKAQTRSQPGA